MAEEKTKSDAEIKTFSYIIRLHLLLRQLHLFRILTSCTYKHSAVLFFLVYLPLLLTPISDIIAIWKWLK